MNRVLANQSLKITEPAVDDLTRAKQVYTIGQDIPARIGFGCCGASPPQLSSGPLGGTSYDLNI